MKQKKIIILLLFLFLYAELALAQNNKNNPIAITTVAVVDIQEVYNAFPDAAKGYSTLSTLKEKYQKEIDAQVEKMNALKRQRHVALEEGQYERAASLEEQITNLANYIESQSARRQNELTQLSKLPFSNEFLKRLQAAIEFVALENGYTVVLHSTTEGLQWWAPVVDISKKVIEKLKS